MATKEEQETAITEAVYRAMMRAIAEAIPANAPPGLDGGMVVFAASGMVAVEFLAQHFSKKSACALIDKWAEGAKAGVLARP